MRPVVKYSTENLQEGKLRGENYEGYDNQEMEYRMVAD